ncbi:hypothetical protein BH11BAC1_BH11BAC1_29990 [soil metagenome]
MKKNIFGFISIAFLLFPLQNFASNYYWVGGTGNYSDVSHWATTSGGSTFQTVSPTSNDDIFFDVNSFPTAGDTMYFDIDYSAAHYFTIAGVLNTPTFADSPAALRIDIVGNFSIAANINWISACALAFSPLAPDSLLTIQTNSVFMPNRVIVDGDISSSVILLDNLECDYLEWDNGNFITSNHNVNTSSGMVGWGSTLYLGTSNISSNGSMDFLGYPVIYGDSAKFISPFFSVNDGIYGLHFGTVNCSIVSAEGCFFKVVQSSGMIGLGNTIDLMTSENIGMSAGFHVLGPNYIKKVITSRTASFSCNAIIDTLIFTEPGIDFGLPDTLTITGEIIMTNTPARPGTIAQANGDSCHILKSSGTVCFDFVTLTNVHAIGGSQFFAGYNSVDGGGNSGFQFTGCTTAGGAWPGDANYDLTVNNLDILAIGLANGETGPVRAGANFGWVEQPVADWTNTFTSGVNMKHADCDGNGIVDAGDTAAVSINYGLHHPAARMIQPVLNPNSTSLLTIQVTPDTVGPSTPVHINIDLGIDSIYGIAFSVFYNPSLINSSSLIPNFSNSWLGTNGVNMIGFAKADPVAGRIDFALTRTDHTDAIAGAGQLVSFDLITSSNIPIGSSLTMEANDVNGIFLAQNYEVINGSIDSTFVDSTVSVHQPLQTISNLTASQFNHELILSYYCFSQTNLKLLLTDITGRELLSQNLACKTGVNKNEIHLGRLAKGIYIVSLSGEGGTTSVKVISQ